MSDSDQPGEDFDTDIVGADYPPDEPLGVDELAGRPRPDRARLEPEVWERPQRSDADDRTVVLDDEGAPVGDDGFGPLADDDQFTGDETTRDYPGERLSPAAEDAAVYLDEDED
jgi:hypothetical protein